MSIIEYDQALLEKQRYAFLALRHVFCPVSKLPNKVMCRIFELYKANMLQHTDPMDSRVRAWGTIPQVFQHWRKVILSSPIFWADISFGNSISWIQEMVERSQNSSLKLRVNFRRIDAKPSTLALLKAILHDHTQRIEEIAFYSLSSSILEEALKEL